MTNPQHRRWHEMTSRDFAHADPERWVALLPVGAVEQHGPHLPLGVDALINQGIVERAVATMPDDLPAIVLPMTWVGRSEEHVDFPGTLTLPAETLRAVWHAIGTSVARAGLRKLVILNSHGGQVQVTQIVARQLRIDHGMFVACLQWGQLGLPIGLFDEGERRHGIHAGAIETSAMLALRPDLVTPEAAENFVPLSKRAEAEFPILMGLGAAGFGWQAQDVHPSGAAGDAASADAERGRRTIDHAAARLNDLLAEVVRYPLANLKDGPAPPEGATDR